MAGEKELKKLLTSLSPHLMSGDFVFCTIRDATYGDHADLSPMVSFSEDEGLTLLVTKEKADRAGLEYESVFKSKGIGIPDKKLKVVPERIITRERFSGGSARDSNLFGPDAGEQPGN